MRTIALRSDGICEFVNLVVSTPREKIPRTIHKSFWCEKCAQAALGSAGNFWIPGDAKILSEFRLVVDMSRRPCGLHSRVCPSGGVGIRSGVEFGREVMECCWRRNLEDLFERKNTSDHCSLKLRGRIASSSRFGFLNASKSAYSIFWLPFFESSWNDSQITALDSLNHAGGSLWRKIFHFNQPSRSHGDERTFSESSKT